MRVSPLSSPLKIVSQKQPCEEDHYAGGASHAHLTRVDIHGLIMFHEVVGISTGSHSSDIPGLWEDTWYQRHWHASPSHHSYFTVR